MNIVSRHDAAGTMTVDQICTAIVYLGFFRQRLLGRLMNLDLVLNNEVIWLFYFFQESRIGGKECLKKAKAL